MPRFLSVLIALAASAAAADTLRLVPAGGKGPVQSTLMKPFEMDLVAARDTTMTEMSAVAYTLDVPEGLVIVGEELLVDSLLGLGTSRGGMNLVFRCTDKTPLPVLRFRFVATRPLANAVVALRPEKKTRFLGIVSCNDQQFKKFACAPDSVVVQAR